MTSNASTWVQRARAGTLPASDRTGRIRCAAPVGPIEQREERRAALTLTADGLGIIEPRGAMLTVADLQARIARERE